MGPAAPFLESGSDKLFQGARSTVTAAFKSLDFVRAQRPAPLVSVREWVKSGRGVLFLPYQADQISALKAIISIWMRLAIFQTISLGEGDHRLWFAVDELDALGAINGLPDALTRLRKFGGRCVLGGSKFRDGRDSEGHSKQTATELAVMAAKIEQLPDRSGYLKFASQPGWMRVAFPMYDTAKVAVPFVPVS